jgi:hypothetical protein
MRNNRNRVLARHTSTVSFFVRAGLELPEPCFEPCDVVAQDFDLRPESFHVIASWQDLAFFLQVLGYVL